MIRNNLIFLQNVQELYLPDEENKFFYLLNHLWIYSRVKPSAHEKNEKRNGISFIWHWTFVTNSTDTTCRIIGHNCCTNIWLFINLDSSNRSLQIQIFFKNKLNVEKEFCLVLVKWCVVPTHAKKVMVSLISLKKVVAHYF